MKEAQPNDFPMKFIRSIFALIADLFSDGYKLVGLLAPLASLSFTLAKAFEAPMHWLKEVSYSWALFPILVWVGVAYTRRWYQFQTLAENQGNVLPSWAELEDRFNKLSGPLTGSRIDGQTGAAGEYWRIAASFSVDASDRFKSLAHMAGQRLLQDVPSEVEKHEELKSEGDPLILWYKALIHIGGRYDPDPPAKQINEDGSSGGYIYTGSIGNPALASATLCLKLAAMTAKISGR